jgi:DNA (cytosine-5)-methyltransferase 1
VNYYNEIDPHAAAWLRGLIAEGHIPAGEVDERSISDVSPTDLLGYTQCHFFSGIGGWSLALRLAGWPDDRPVWTGSCPCQPFSSAGKGLGRKDPRHLWPAFRRLINRCRPPVVFGEQVASTDGRRWLAGVFANLETMGFAPAALDLCAAGIGAPHIRQRLWWVGERLADASGSRRFREIEDSERDPRDEARMFLPSESGGAGGLADAGHQPEGRATGSSEEECRRTFGESAGCCDTGRLGNPDHAGPQGHCRNGDHRNQPGWLGEEQAGSARQTGGLARGRPTPMAGTPAQNGNNEAGNNDSSRKTVEVVSGLTPGSSSAGTESTAGFQLNPRFSLWLMGYPTSWHDVGVSALRSSRELATPSSRNSRRSSSKRSTKRKEGPEL